ncbi:DUF1758 domain-containing protein [Trichonephila clavipes]|nr:DUF1758 domain-containing protein [Trichonephila clavipes]
MLIKRNKFQVLRLLWKKSSRSRKIRYGIAELQTVVLGPLKTVYIKDVEVKILSVVNGSGTFRVPPRVFSLKMWAEPSQIMLSLALCSKLGLTTGHDGFRWPRSQSESVVDACISQRWELSLKSNKIPTLEEFRVFIEREARGLNEFKFLKPDINKVSPSVDTEVNSVDTVSNNCTQSAEGYELLSTALINVKSKHGQQITCHALIDNASKNSLISKQCADRLKLPLKHTNHKSVGVNETFAETSLYSTNFEFSSCVFAALLVIPSKSFVSIDIPSKVEDELCESIFVNSHIRNADGRYILKLPFRDDSSLGDSKNGALKRLYSYERKLHSNSQLKEQYTEFMEEYQNLSHKTPLASVVKYPHYFLPHHGVVNDNSSTTKLSVVFDGSFKSTNGNSLNDILLTDLWKTGLDWDDEISSDILNRCNRFPTEISCLKQIKVPRFLDKLSSCMKVVRTVAWIFRFYHNSTSLSKVSRPLYTHELETSMKKVVKVLQNGEYHTELTLLKCNKHLPKSSKLQSLNVFLHSEGILRVGGRLLLQKTLNFEQKHPMLIPKKSSFYKYNH